MTFTCKCSELTEGSDFHPSRRKLDGATSEFAATDARDNFARVRRISIIDRRIAAIREWRFWQLMAVRDTYLNLAFPQDIAILNPTI
jgi:hypothetical protein